MWELSSWTPDYTLDQESAPSPLVPNDRRPNIYAASGYDHRSKFRFPAAPVNLNWRQLQTRGISIDCITRLSNPGKEGETFGSKTVRWLSSLFTAQEFLQGMTKDVQNSLEILQGIVAKYSEYHFSNDRAGLRFKSPEKNRPIKDNPILDGFINTLLLSRKGRFSYRERMTKDDLDEILSMQLLTSFSETKESAHLDEICQAFEEGSRWRRVLITEKGHIGSAPPTAEEGDIVCVLYGCSVPVILRKVQDQELYEFVGECYLHGFMDAEAIALQIRGVLTEQEFTLV